MNKKIAIFIPARLNSSRFPRKVITPINGIPMIVHIFKKAQSLDLGECYVACCSEEIKKIVEEHGGKAILTDPNIPSGTDRVSIALQTLLEKPDIIVNLQGDMPVFSENIIPEIVDVLQKNEDIDVTTPVALIKDKKDINDENKIKVVFENMEQQFPGKAIYFSRVAIPSGAKIYYYHIGIYAFKRNAIEKFVNLKTSYLEKIERLEQLRCLENNMRIWAVPVDETTVSIDIANDLRDIRMLQ